MATTTSVYNFPAATKKSDAKRVARKFDGYCGRLGLASALGRATAAAAAVLCLAASFLSCGLQALAELRGCFALSHHARRLKVLALSRLFEDAGLLDELVELLET